MSIALLSWNVAGRVRRLPEQAERIVGAAPEVVCLQEVIGSTAAEWTRLLSDAGYSHIALADPEPALAQGRMRPRPTLTAARRPFGDLNTPRKEHADGRVWTFARDRYGRLRPDRGERWDAAELALIRGLEEHGFRDAFRDRHGPEWRELSWEWPRWGGGYRLDHLVVSEEVAVTELSYLHDWRREGLSDHSPLLARIAVRPDRSRTE